MFLCADSTYEKLDRRPYASSAVYERALQVQLYENVSELRSTGQTLTTDDVTTAAETG